MGRRRSKHKPRGVLGAIVNGTHDDSDSTEAPTVGPIFTRMQNVSISTEGPALTEEECVRAEDEQKTCVYREDSILSEGDYRKGVEIALKTVANLAGESGKAWSSQLRRLLLSRHNSPLQLWWAFTAAEKYVQLENNAGSLWQAADIMDFISRLLVSLKALSAMNASGFLAIAALAPVVALLHDVATSLHKSICSSKWNDVDSDSVDGKKSSKLLRKLRELIRETLCFVVDCRRRDFSEFRRLSTLPSADESARWKSIESVYPQFPLASKHMNKALNNDPLNSAGIAEVVSVELVILQLVVETIDWRCRLKKKNKKDSVKQEGFAEKIKSLARHSVFTGSTLSVSGMLLDTLLEKRLPVGNLLDDVEEKLARECLIDTVLMDPSSFGLLEQATEKGVELSIVLFMKKLAVGRRAIQNLRAQEDRKRADALSTRITSWQTPPQLMKWLQAQKKHLLPVTALLGSQAFLSWVSSTFDGVAFTSILDRCVKAFSPEVLTQKASGETKDNDHELEGGGKDLFFVDTSGDRKDESNIDAAADLAFTTAAKDISKGKAKGKKGKERGPIYKRLPQEATGFEKTRGKIITDELEDVKSDSDDEDSTMVEDTSRAEDLVLADEDPSSGDDPCESLFSKVVSSKKEEEKEPTEVSKGESSAKAEAENFEGEVVAKLTTPPMSTEDAQVTAETEVVREEVPDVPNGEVVQSKEVPRESDKDSARDTGVDPDIRLVPAILPSEKEDTQGTGDTDQVMGQVRIEPGGTQSNQEELSVEKMAEVSNVGSIKQAEVAAVSVLITSPTSKIDTPAVTGKDQVMVEAAEIATTGKLFSTKKIKSKRNADPSGGKDRVVVETLQSPASQLAETEQETTDALASAEIASSSETPGKSRRGRKVTAADKDSKPVEVVTSPVAVTMQNELEIHVVPSSVHVTSSEISSESKRGKKGAENKHMGTVDSASLVTAEKDAVVMEAPVSVPVPSSETSTRSKHDKQATDIMDTETVDSAPPVRIDKDAKPTEPPPSVHVSSSESKQGKKGTDITDIQTVDSVPSAAPIVNERNSEEREATPSSTLLDSVETLSKSKRGKKATLDKGVETVENVVSSSCVITGMVSETQDTTPANASDETRSKRKRGKVSLISTQTEAVHSPIPVTCEESDMQAASTVSPLVSEETANKSRKSKKASSNKDSGTLEYVVSPTSITSNEDFGIQCVSLSTLVTSNEVPPGRKRGRKVQANKNRDLVESSLSESQIQMEIDHEIQESPQVTLVGVNESPSMVGCINFKADKGQVEEDIPSSTITDSRAGEQLPLSQAPVDVDQKTVEDMRLAALTSSEQTGMTQASAERDLETMTNVPSPVSPTSKKKRGRKPKPRDPDGNVIPAPPPTRRISTRGTTPHIVIEKEEEKVDEEDLGPVVLVTPHKNPRKSRRKVTVQEPQEKVNEVPEVPALDPAVPSAVQQCQSYANLIATVETGIVLPSTSVQATPGRSRKRTNVISDDDREGSPTPSVQVTPSRGRKSTKVNIVTDDEVNPTPTSSMQATLRRGRKMSKATKVVTDDDTDDTQTTPRRGRKSTRATKVVTDEDTDDTKTNSVQATSRRRRKSTRATKVVTDDDTDDTQTNSVQAAPRRGRKSTRATKVVTDDDTDDTQTNSVQATPRRGRKSTRATKVVTDDDTDDPQTTSVQATPRRGRNGAKAMKVVTDDTDDTHITLIQATPRRGRKSTKAKVTTDDETDATSTPSVQATTSRGQKAVKAKVDFEEISSRTDEGTQSRGRKGSKSTDVDGDGWMLRSATKTPSKKAKHPSQPPEENQEVDDQPDTVHVFTPRRSKRGAGASQVVGKSVDMASSPYRSSKKRKTTLPMLFHPSTDASFG